MSKPSSDVAICNLALSLLKEQSISALTGNDLTKTESLCALWLVVDRQRFLRAYNPNFALVGAAINRGGDPDLDEYDDYYTLPNDFLKLRAIIDPAFPLGRRTYEIQGANLLFNNNTEDTLDIWYTADNGTYTVWSSDAIVLFVHEFALKLGKKLTARPSIIKDIREDIILLKKDFNAAKGQERPPKRYESSRIVNAGLNVASNRTVAGAYEFPEGMDD